MILKKDLKIRLKKASFIIISSFILFLIVLNYPASSKQNIIKPTSEDEIVQRCMNQSLQKTTKCMVSQVESFYKYSVTEDTENPSFKELATKGGDCEDYTSLYASLVKKIGFNGTTVKIPIKPQGDTLLGHQFYIVYDAQGYCVVDQLNYQCTDYEK